MLAWALVKSWPIQFWLNPCALASRRHEGNAEKRNPKSEEIHVLGKNQRSKFPCPWFRTRLSVFFRISELGFRFLSLPMTTAPHPLTTLTAGGRATVAQINVPPGSRARLMEMGLLSGTKVELVRFAPMGDPVEIKVRGYNLTLRKSEAEQILVRMKS